MLGTAIGILPGTVAATIFGGQLEAALANPHAINYWLIAAAVALLIGATWAVRRWILASTSSTSHDIGSRTRTA
jgi:uncharacterized membrane protein YdjX (TVP38/TMEM64 family)